MDTKIDPTSVLQKVRSWLQKIVALLLWLVTVGIGLVEIYLLQQTSMRIYVYFASEREIAILIGYIVAFLAAIMWLFLAIGSGEYHAKNVGKHGSWTLFAWIVAIELLILILYFVV